MKWGKLLLGSMTTVLVILMVTPLVVNLSSDPVPRAADTYDSYDPNNSFGTAANIPAGFTHNLLVDHLDDWFYIYVANSYRLSVNLNWTAASDLDLYLYDGDQVMLNYSASGSLNPEKVSYDVITPGNYYVRVHRWDGGETPYSLYLNNSVLTQYKLLTLLDAYNSYNMSVSIHGTGLKYGSCVDIDLQWVAGFAEYTGVRIYVPLGLTLETSITGFSQMIIAYTTMVTLTYSGDSEQLYAYAFSTDILESAPASYIDLTPYESYSTASDTTKVLAYCAANSYYSTHEGQVAIWVTTEGSSYVTSEYYSSSEVATVNAILSGAGTSLQLTNYNSFNPMLFFSIFVPIIIIIIVIIAVAVSVKQRGGFSHRIAVKQTMYEQPVRAPATFASSPQPNVVPQAQPVSIWSQPAFQQAPAPNVVSPAPESKDRSCTSCGARLDVTERFCHNCGVDTEAKQ